MLEFDEIWFNLLDDTLLVKKHFNHLESSHSQFYLDDESLKKYKKAKNKGSDIESALAILKDEFVHFQEAELKWLRKEVSSISDCGL